MGTVFGTLSTIAFVTAIGVGTARGGYEAYSNQQQVCQEVTDALAEINDYNSRSDATLQCLQQMDDQVIQALQAQQLKLTQANAKLAHAQSQFQASYVTLEVIVVCALIAVGALLTAKRLGII